MLIQLLKSRQSIYKCRPFYTVLDHISCVIEVDTEFQMVPTSHLHCDIRVVTIDGHGRVGDTNVASGDFFRYVQLRDTQL